MSDPVSACVDFQSEENRWAAQMACDEANAVLGGENYWNCNDVRRDHSAFYALALRILRTEKKPVDPLLLKAREIVVSFYREGGLDYYVKEFLAGERDHSAEVIIALAALKERSL